MCGASCHTFYSSEYLVRVGLFLKVSFGIDTSVKVLATEHTVNIFAAISEKKIQFVKYSTFLFSI